MTVSISTRLRPDPSELVEWLRQARRSNGVAEARKALVALQRQFPDDPAVTELMQWHDERWWQPVRFGGISLARRTPEAFEFVWSVVLDRVFSSLLMSVPDSVTPKDLLEELSADEHALIPERNAIQWLILVKNRPIGLIMLTHLNFQHRIADIRLGAVPGHGQPLAVLDACCAALLVAFNCLGLNKVQARIEASNELAIKLAEQAGFVAEAGMRQDVWNASQQRYEDLVQFSIFPDEFSRNPLFLRRANAPRDPWLNQRVEWPRHPLQQFRG